MTTDTEAELLQRRPPGGRGGAGGDGRAGLRENLAGAALILPPGAVAELDAI